MRGDECHRQEKLVPCARNKPMHNARNMSRIKTLREHLLKVKGVRLQRKMIQGLAMMRTKIRAYTMS